MFSKKLLFIAAIACMPAMANAQVGAAVNSVSPVKIALGIKAGANFQKLKGDTWGDANRTGYFGGLFLNATFKKYGVSGEVLFSQTSFTTTGTKLNNAKKAAAATNYSVIDSSAKEGAFAVTTISVPILFNLKVIKNLWLQVGPQYSAVISVKDKDGLVSDANDLFKSGDISGVIGAHLNLPVNLSIGARYIMGFSDVNATNNSASESWRNRSAQIYIGYSFL
jgi:hypothetical protein